MSLLKKIVATDADKARQQEAVAAVLIENEQDLMDLWNITLEDRTWQRIVKALAARGFPAAQEEMKTRQL